jgi:hypothetical protein
MNPQDGTVNWQERGKATLTMNGRHAAQVSKPAVSRVSKPASASPLSESAMLYTGRRSELYDL